MNGVRIVPVGRVGRRHFRQRQAREMVQLWKWANGTSWFDVKFFDLCCVFVAFEHSLLRDYVVYLAYNY